MRNVSMRHLAEGAGEAYSRGRMSNPLLAGSVLDPDEAGERDLISVSLTTSLVDLITLPEAVQFGQGRICSVEGFGGRTVFWIWPAKQRWRSTDLLPLSSRRV